MFNKIIRFSLNNRLLVLVASALLLVAGTYTATTMDVDVFPDLNAPTVTVMTEAKGMAPEEVERLVTFPIETAVNGATDVRRVRSSSTTGFSIVWVEFDWGTDIYRARQIVSEKIATVMDALPQHVGTPTLGPQSSILGEVLFVALTVDDELKINSTGTHEEDENHPDGNNSQLSIVKRSSLPEGKSNSQLEKTSLQDLRTLADWTIRPRLLATGGVAQVAVLGGEVKEYQILLSPEKMMHYGVSLSEVLEATRGMNQNATGGTLYEYGNEYIIRGMLSTNSVEEIGMTVVKQLPTDNGQRTTDKLNQPEDNFQFSIFNSQFDFIVDAIDTIAPKCALIVEALRRHIPIVSSMGAGAKSDITQIRFADIWDTYHCGLAKAVRTRLKKAGIRQSLPVVFSTEQADRSAIITIEGEQNKKSTAGTISYMPAVFGCYLAEYVLRKL